MSSLLLVLPIIGLIAIFGFTVRQEKGEYSSFPCTALPSAAQKSCRRRLRTPLSRPGDDGQLDRRVVQPN